MSRLPSFDEEDSLLDKHPLINPNFQNKTNLQDVYEILLSHERSILGVRYA
jgi:hypothetical protein